MRNNLLLTPGVFLFLITSLVAQAQNYAPIKSSHVYQYIANDSIYSINGGWADPGTNVSVVRFNRVVKKGKIRVGSAACLGTNTTYNDQVNNQFGEKIIEQPGGEFTFVVAFGTTFPRQQQEFLLKTKIPVGTTWLMNVSANLSATLTGKNVATFCGISDSVLTYNLSDGKQLTLSKNYGMVQAPNFTAYVANSDFKKRVLQLYKLPESYPQQPFNSPFKVFDFQPNDSFSYYKKDFNPTFSKEEWYQNKILTRTDDPTTNSITYTFLQRKLTRTSFVSNPGRFILVPPVIQNLVIDQNTYPELSLRTNEYLPGSTFFNSPDRAQVNVAITKQSQYYQREIIKITDYEYEAFTGQNCGTTFTYSPDVERYIAYGFGLGKVSDYAINMWPNFFSETLEAYVKGTETYGTWPIFAQIMSTQEALEPVSFSVFPNPFTEEISLKFSSGFKAEKATVTIFNALGQEIYTRQLSAVSEPEIKLALPDLAKGIYLLQLNEAGKVFSRRLIKE